MPRSPYLFASVSLYLLYGLWYAWERGMRSPAVLVLLRSFEGKCRSKQAVYLYPLVALSNLVQNPP